MSDSPTAGVPLPAYLERNYWWAYLHPLGVRIFDHPAMVNLILWGNYRRLGDAVLSELDAQRDRDVLQVACVYGGFTPRLVDRLHAAGRLSVVDVAPVQLQNLARKLKDPTPVRLYHQDSTKLAFAAESFDVTIVFFLLHEQPEPVRRRTLAETLRVLRPGGRLIVVDYHRPHRLHPLRWPMYAVLRRLEPFALDLWRGEIADWLPAGGHRLVSPKRTFFGGLYQQLVFAKG